VRRLVAACLLLAAARGAGAYEEPVSAFAASVGARDGSSGSAPGVTVYLVPDERTFLLTDILVANHGQEVGPLYLADSQRTRCSVELLETMLLPNNPQGSAPCRTRTGARGDDEERDQAPAPRP